MKLLLDQGLPIHAAELFRLLGHDCVHVSEKGMQRASDEEIVEMAAKQECIVITLDADFHALIAVRQMRFPSVIRLRQEGCRGDDVVRILQPVLFRYQEQLGRGCLISVKERQTTMRILPIGSD